MVNKIELYKEYTYKEICEIFGWKVTSGEAKQRQLKYLNKYFDVMHPIKNGKENRRIFIFIKQYENVENEIADGRKNNKGTIGNKGNTKSDYPMDKFEYLFLRMIRKNMNSAFSNNRLSNYGCIYVNSKIIYEEIFGIDIYDVLNNIKEKECDLFAKKVIFSNIINSVCSYYSKNKICKYLGQKKNSLEKGILMSSFASDGIKYTISNDKLLDEYNYIEQQCLEKNKLTQREAISKNVYIDLQENVKDYFKKKYGYEDIRRVYKIDCSDLMDKIDNMNFDIKLTKQYQHDLLEYILVKIDARVESKIEKENPKFEISDYHKKCLQMYMEDFKLLSNNLKPKNDTFYKIDCFKTMSDDDRDIIRIIQEAETDEKRKEKQIEYKYINIPITNTYFAIA